MCYELFGNFIPFHKTLNQLTTFVLQMQRRSGLLAKGPKKIMDAYAAVLKKHNLEFTFLGSKKEVSEKPKMLLLGDSYVIADEFHFTELV